MVWHDLKNPALQKYLAYVENTETPRIMHIWAFMTCAGACMGRKVWLPFGFENIYPNLFTLLVGPPGSRKSTAIKITQKLVRRATNVRFAPDDTAGQRKGLIRAMEGKDHQVDDEEIKKLEIAAEILDLETLGNVEISSSPHDAHSIFAIASEFSSFIGHNAIDLCNFLNKVYDGEDYDYKISEKEHILKEPLLSILGGTTATNIADTIPAAAIGHGFTSRIIFVYANKKYKKVARPKKLDKELEKELLELFGTLFYNYEGPMLESKAAQQLIEDLYECEVELNDPRFIYYLDRRQGHLLKASMILAALRKSMVIDAQDILEANKILTYTEKTMPEALGEYGLSKLATAKQKMVEFLQHAKGPVSEDILFVIMQRDMQRVDFLNSLMELCNAGKIKQVTTSQGKAFIYNDMLFDVDDELESLLAENEDELKHG